MTSNNFYDLNYDARKNRFYLTVKGFWNSIDVAKDYLNDWMTQTKNAKSGFTVVADLRTMKAPPAAVFEYHKNAQEHLLNNGLRKTAEIVSSAITKLSVNRLSRTSGMDVLKRQFHSLHEVEAWLDSYDD